MLALTRKIDESVVIGNDICVTILGIKGDSVRVGIEAPSSLRIYRSELLEQIKAINIAAAQAPSANEIFNGF